MDFFAAQDDARARTRRLILLYLLTLAALMLLTHTIGVGIMAGVLHNRHSGEVHFWRYFFRLDLFISFSALMIMTIFLGTIVKIFALRHGGSAVAKDLGGQELSRHSNDTLEKRLLNIVEEMAIASGMPVPRVFLLHNEQGINAFAAGYKLEDAAIGVTRGAIENLSRDQLQGVIAHEFSHILNADMRLNIRMIGILNGVLCIYLLGKTVLQMLSDTQTSRNFSRRRNDKDNPLAIIFLIGVALVVIGSIGAFFARMIQAAVSRQREFLADSSAVQFTRYPEGISGALETIASIKDGSRLAHFRAPEAEHMLFSSGTGGFPAFLFATHPPLQERIRRLTGRIIKVSMPKETAGEQIPSAAERIVLPESIKPLAAPVTSSIGTLSPLQLVRARELINQLPEAIVTATRDLQGAQCILAALMIGWEELLNESQLQLITSPENPLSSTEIFKLAPLIAALPVNRRLAILDLAIPTLRKLTPRQYTPFNALLKALAEADRRITLPEYLLLTILRRSIEPLVFSIAPSRFLSSSRAELAAPLATILSAIAQVSSKDDSVAANHFEQVTTKLNKWPTLLRSSRESLTFTTLDENLDKLANACPALKREIIEACNAIIMVDNTANARELELFRAVCAALGCPVPLIEAS